MIRLAQKGYCTHGKKFEESCEECREEYFQAKREVLKEFSARGENN